MRLTVSSDFQSSSSLLNASVAHSSLIDSKFSSRKFSSGAIDFIIHRDSLTMRTSLNSRVNSNRSLIVVSGLTPREKLTEYHFGVPHYIVPKVHQVLPVFESWYISSIRSRRYPFNVVLGGCPLVDINKIYGY